MNVSAPRSPARVLFDALASLRLAVTVMVTLGVTSLAATIYESKYNTAAAQRDIYQTWWFAAILVALGINIFCAMMSRYPWKKHHVGFVMAHIGILTLLVGSLISLHYGLDSNMAVYEGETTDRVTLFDKVVDVELPGGQRTRVAFDFEKHRPRPDNPRRFPLKGTKVTLVADDFHAHVRMLETFEEGTSGPPALRFTIEGPFGKQDSWLVADDPERHSVDFGPASFVFHASGAGHEHSVEGRNHMAFALRADGRLAYTLSSTKAKPMTGVVEVGTPIVATQWMGMKITVDRFYAASAKHREVVGEEPPNKDSMRQPAIHFHLESADGATSQPAWLAWSSAAHVPFQGGTAALAYRPTELSVPFRVTLTDFNSEKYPGSNRPATYESYVRVEDPERGSSDHHISMNHPLHYRGYIFFQSSFCCDPPVEGQPMMSVLSVARAPGLPLVYLGTTLISLGVVWMFYVKPYLARRQAAQALKAHREREAQHDQKAVSSPAAAASGPVEAAGSGA
jgi:hypothetical protein